MVTGPNACERGREEWRARGGDSDGTVQACAAGGEPFVGLSGGGGGRLRDRGYRRDGRLFRHAIRKASERRGESDRLVAFTPRDGQKPRFGGNRDRFAPTGSAAWSIIILCRAPADIYFRRS